jgi:hypothetical protein
MLMKQSPCPNVPAARMNHRETIPIRPSTQFLIHKALVRVNRRKLQFSCGLAVVADDVDGDFAGVGECTDGEGSVDE